MFSQAGLTTSPSLDNLGLPVSPNTIDEGGLWVSTEREDAVMEGEGLEMDAVTGAVEAGGYESAVCDDGVARVRRKEQKSPSKAEWDMHFKTHIPFRSWCPICVPGRKPNWGHYVVPNGDRSRTCPEIHFDYCFFREKPAALAAPTLVIKDRESRALAAHVVPYKGASVEWLVQQIHRDLLRLGVWDGCRAVLRSDQEVALLDVLRAVAAARGDESRTCLEQSPVKESSSNGFIEAGVQSLEGMTRTLWIGLKARIGRTVPVDHPIFAWLVEHAADLHTKLQVGADGRTGFRRLRGRPYTSEMPEFGCKVWHKIPGKPQGGVLAERWLEGIWLGKRWATDEHIVSMPGGRVVRARAILEYPEEGRWDAEAVMGITGAPWAPSGTMTYTADQTHEAMPGRAKFSDAAIPIPSVVPRGARVEPKHVEKYGKTDGCSKCHRNVHRHSAACRERMLGKMKDDPEEKDNVEDKDDKKTKYLAETLGREMDKQNAEEQEPNDSAQESKRRRTAEQQEETSAANAGRKEEEEEREGVGSGVAAGPSTSTSSSSSSGNVADPGLGAGSGDSPMETAATVDTAAATSPSQSFEPSHGMVPAEGGKKMSREPSFPESNSQRTP